MRLIAILFFIFIHCDVASACKSIGSKQSDLSLSGKIKLNADTCYLAKTLTLRSDLDLIANQFGLFIDAVELVAEEGSRIGGLDYDALNFQATFPPLSNPDRGIAPGTKHFQPGPETDGNPDGDGRDGGAYPGVGSPPYAQGGASGLNAREVIISVRDTARGHLRVDNRGANGQLGASGAKGYDGGYGEQGRAGKRASPIGCDRGGGFGGRGGRGSIGDNGGSGGSAGSGGDLRISVGGNARALLVEYAVDAGLPGPPGLPGRGGLPGLQGCGGRSDQGQCGEVARRQGVIGSAGSAGLFAGVGNPGTKGRIAFQGNFRSKERGRDTQCRTTNPYDPQRSEAIDKLQTFAFWSTAGRELLGANFRFVDLANQEQALVIEGKFKDSILGFLDPRKLISLWSQPGARPQPPQPGCLGKTCCQPTVWIGCLAAPLWQLQSNRDGIERYRARLTWKESLLELLHAETTRSLWMVPSPGEESAWLHPNETYVKLPVQYPGYVPYLRIDEGLFARIAVTLSILTPGIRSAIDARVRPDLTALRCAFGQAERVASPDSTFFHHPQTGALKSEHGFSNIYAISGPILLQDPTPTPSFVVIPIGFHRSETIFNKLIVEPYANRSMWPERPGFGSGGFCQMLSQRESPLDNRLPNFRNQSMNCGGSLTGKLDLLYTNWSALDVPTVIFELSAISYIDAMLRSEKIALSGTGDLPELADHCLKM